MRTLRRNMPSNSARRAMNIQIGVDIVIFTVQDSALKILLTRRAKPPFKGRLASPGRPIGADESLERAALRELKEETGARNVYLEQLYSFDDPRGRMVTVAYYALVPGDRSDLAPSNGSDAEWRRADRLPPLAFDHR